MYYSFQISSALFKEIKVGHINLLILAHLPALKQRVVVMERNATRGVLDCVVLPNKSFLPCETNVFIAHRPIRIINRAIFSPLYHDRAWSVRDLTLLFQPFPRAKQRLLVESSRIMMRRLGPGRSAARLLLSSLAPLLSRLGQMCVIQIFKKTRTDEHI